MHGYFGMTVHFVNNDWKLKSYLLCCKQMKGRHTGEIIHVEYENVLQFYGIEDKVFKAVTDNGANMVKAFNVTFEELNADTEESSPENEEEEDPDDILTETPLVDIDESLLLLESDRVKCCAHTSQLKME